MQQVQLNIIGITRVFSKLNCNFFCDKILNEFLLSEINYFINFLKAEKQINNSRKNR